METGRRAATLSIRASENPNVTARRDPPETEPTPGRRDAEWSARLDAFNEYRPLLLSIAYRMLGSVADAEDLVQDTFIRWQQTCNEAIKSPRAFLVTILSRLCINHLQSARVRREQYVGSWLPEPLMTESTTASPALTSPADDSLSMAFLLVLERLSPVERAVFLLREVFDYEYAEISRIVGHKEAACRQILRRARQRVRSTRPRFHVSSQHREDLFQRFQDASSRHDMKALIALLHDDVVLYADGGGKTAAVPRPVRGAANVARFILRAPAKLLPKGLVRRRCNINGQPAIVSYLDGRPHSVFSIEVAGDRLRNIYIVSNPDKLSRLPELPV